MKRKQFMSKLAALSMAAMMGVTALPAMSTTVMSADVQNVTNDTTTAASAAASSLVQTTLPTSLTDADTLAAFQTAYSNYDAAVEETVATWIRMRQQLML